MASASDRQHTVPVVTCPGCNTPMRAIERRPASGALQTVTFRCDRCGTETKRELAR